MADALTAKSPFLSLPRELCDKIYEMALLVDQPVVPCQLGNLRDSFHLQTKNSPEDAGEFQEDLLRAICDARMQHFHRFIRDRIRRHLDGDKETDAIKQNFQY